MDANIEELLLLARQYQSTSMVLDEITPRQLAALHTRIHTITPAMDRETKLRAFTLICGYAQCVKSSRFLSKADATGIMDLSDTEFAFLWLWAIEETES